MNNSVRVSLNASKTHYGFYKNGQPLAIHCLSLYCRQNNLSVSQMYALRAGEIKSKIYKGHTYNPDREEEMQEEVSYDPFLHVYIAGKVINVDAVRGGRTGKRKFIKNFKNNLEGRNEAVNFAKDVAKIMICDVKMQDKVRVYK